MYRYNLKEYKTKLAVIWAAFFDKLGLSTEYRNNDNDIETFTILGMNTTAIIFNQAKYTVSAMQSFCIKNGLLSLDTGKVNTSTGHSVVLLCANPWEDNSSIPLCTTHSKMHGYQTLCPNTSITGTFMVLYDEPIFVVDNLEDNVHCRGNFIASHDLRNRIPDAGVQTWTKAAKYASAFNKQLNNIYKFQSSLPEFHQGQSDDAAQLVSRPDGRLEIVSGKVMKAVKKMSPKVEAAEAKGDDDVWNRLTTVCAGHTYDDFRSERTVTSSTKTDPADSIEKLNATQDHLITLMQAAIAGLPVR